MLTNIQSDVWATMLECGAAVFGQIFNLPAKGYWFDHHTAKPVNDSPILCIIYPVIEFVLQLKRLGVLPDHL